MDKRNFGLEFLKNKHCGFIGDAESGDTFVYSDGSGYYHGKDGSEGQIYSDGSGYYKGADGSEGYIYSDGSAYYRGADGSEGHKYSDGSGFFNGSDGRSGNVYSDGSGYYDSISFWNDELENDTTDNSEPVDLKDVGIALGAIAGVSLLKKAHDKKKKTEEQFRNTMYQKAEEHRSEIRSIRKWTKGLIYGGIIFIILVLLLAGL